MFRICSSNTLYTPVLIIKKDETLKPEVVNFISFILNSCFPATVNLFLTCQLKGVFAKNEKRVKHTAKNKRY